MDKITQALKKHLPANAVAEITAAIEEIMAEHYEEVEAQAQAKLDAAYEQLSEERARDEQIAEAGYQQAYEIIASLMNRLDEQRQEFEEALEEGFEEAYNELEREKGKNGNVEVELYDEFDNKLHEMKELMIDKIDQFLSLQEGEIYESAKRDVLNDPRVLEQRVAVEKMAEILSDYMSSDDLSGFSTAKMEEVHRQNEALRGQIRLLESKSVKLKVQNDRLQEQVNEAREYITEATKVERKVRTNRRGNASGRGQRVVNEQLINEFVSPTNASANDRNLTEGNDPLNDLLVLSGLSESR